MPAKHLILVHGRSTKPRRPEEERYLRTALAHGLNRVAPVAAGLIESGEVKLTCVYYGDVCNELLCDAEPQLKTRLVLNPVDGVFYEPDGYHDARMTELLSRPTDAHTRHAFEELAAARRGRRLRDEAASLVRPLLARRLTPRSMRRRLPDLAAYLGRRTVGSRIRQRVQAPLLNALTDADDVAVVSHCMGCVATYDVLWKFSQMSEYEFIHDRRVTLWITLGSPLGERAVRESLYDAHEPADGRFPRNVVRWLNVAAHDDAMARDAAAERDFVEMKAYGCRIVDLSRVYTFWVGPSGPDPHEFYGYLDHPVVAEQVAAWVLGN